MCRYSRHHIFHAEWRRQWINKTLNQLLLRSPLLQPARLTGQRRYDLINPKMLTIYGSKTIAFSLNRKNTRAVDGEPAGIHSEHVSGSRSQMAHLAALSPATAPTRSSCRGVRRCGSACCHPAELAAEDCQNSPTESASPASSRLPLNPAPVRSLRPAGKANGVAWTESLLSMRGIRRRCPRAAAASP